MDMNLKFYSTAISDEMMICFSKTNIDNSILYYLHIPDVFLCDGGAIMLAQKIISKCKGRLARFWPLDLDASARILRWIAGKGWSEHRRGHRRHGGAGDGRGWAGATAGLGPIEQDMFR